MRFSVIICTHDRSDLFDLALQALVTRTTEKPDEIVIVNAGRNRIDETVESYQSQNVELKLITSANQSLAANRNIGIRNCTGDIIAMTDDDGEVFPDWITRMKRAHRMHPEAGAVGGPVIGVNMDSIVGRVSDIVTFPSWCGPQYVRTLPGVNISYKRSVIQEVGMQDEALLDGFFSGEDVDYNWRVKKLGYEIYFDPAIKVWHHHRPTLRGLLNQHYMYGRAYYLVRRKWPDMYCIYPHGFRRPKDFVKAVHTLALPFYQPFLSARHLSNWMDRLRALPILFAVGLAWEYGMLVQKMKTVGLGRGRR